MPIVFIAYPNPTPVSGSANPKEPAGPGPSKSLVRRAEYKFGHRLAETQGIRNVNLHHFVTQAPSGRHGRTLQRVADVRTQAQLRIGCSGASRKFGDRPRSTRP